MTAPRHLRLALVCGDFAVDGPAGLGGGIETYVRVMARGLAAAGHDVHVVTRALHHTHTVLADGARWHAVHVPDEWPADAADLGEAREALAFAWHAWRQVRALTAWGGPFDAIEAPEYKAQGHFLAADRDLPVVLKCHAHLKLCLDTNGVALGLDTALIADAEREALRRAVAVHANSRALAERVASDYGLEGGRIATVPYGIDTARFQPTASRLRETWGVGPGPVALFVGRLEPRKGIDTLVPAFVEVARSRPDATLIVAGPDTTGPAGRASHGQWMREAWAAAGLATDRVRMLGPVAPAELPALYSAADVMVAPSPYEAFGLVYLEAMACGCPPIGCAAGGVPEVVRDGVTGLLVPPGDVAALAAAMTGLLGDEPRRRQMAADGCALVARTFTREAMVRRTEDLYRAVAARREEAAA